MYYLRIDAVGSCGTMEAAVNLPLIGCGLFRDVIMKRLPPQMDGELLRISCFGRPNQHIRMVRGC